MLLRRARFRQPDLANAFIATFLLLLLAPQPSAKMESGLDAHRSYAGGGYAGYGGHGGYVGNGGHGGHEGYEEHGGYGGGGSYGSGGYGKSGGSAYYSSSSEESIPMSSSERISSSSSESVEATTQSTTATQTPAQTPSTTTQPSAETTTPAQTSPEGTTTPTQTTPAQTGGTTGGTTQGTTSAETESTTPGETGGTTAAATTEGTTPGRTGGTTSSETGGTTPSETTQGTTQPVCMCPSGNCPFVLQNDNVTAGAYTNPGGVSSVASCGCADDQTESCYPTNSDPNTVDLGVNTIIDLSCPDPTMFCVCSATGECFEPIMGVSLSDLYFFSYNDSSGCNVYVQPYCNNPPINLSDGLKSTSNTSTTQFTCEDAQNDGTVGAGSGYIAVLSASCAGCSTIQSVTAATCQIEIPATTTPGGSLG